MTRSHISQLVLALLAATAALVIACSGSSDSPTGTPTPTSSLNVVTTIYPVTYFSQQIGGERVSVRSLIQPGVEAHDFEPTPGDIRAISAADVLVYVGPDFEAWVADAVRSIGNSLIVVETGGTPAATAGDPHVWLDPVQAIEQVRRIEDAFIAADAAGADTYSTNADALVSELTELDREFAEGLNTCSLNSIVVSHEAYGHLANRYGIEQIGLAGISAEFESTPQRIAEVIREMEAMGIGYILQEPIASDDLAKTVAAETGAQILPLYPLESLTVTQVENGENYFTVMRQNLQSLRTALRCN